MNTRAISHLAGMAAFVGYERRNPASWLCGGRLEHLHRNTEGPYESPDPMECWMLYRLARAARGNALELGSWRGRSSCFIVEGLRDGAGGLLTCVDHFLGDGTGGEGADKQAFMDAIGKAGHEIELIDRDMLGIDWGRVVRNVDFVFYDAVHEMEPAAIVLERLHPHLNEGCVVAMHDSSFAGSIGAIGRLHGLYEVVVDLPVWEGFAILKRVDGSWHPWGNGGGATGIVLAHGGVADTVRRHLPDWLAHFDDLVFVTPENDMLSFSMIGRDFMVHGRGLSCHNGHDACERMRFACGLAAGAERAVVFEYDTLFFREIPLCPESVAMGSCLFTHDFKGFNKDFKSGWWLHSPWLADPSGWLGLSKIGVGLEPTYPDRWHAAACDAAGLKPHALSKGYSQNSIIEAAHVAEAVSAVLNGAAAIHGVKCQEVLNKIKAAFLNS